MSTASLKCTFKASEIFSYAYKEIYMGVQTLITYLKVLLKDTKFSVPKW
jgi:hypothetical protein